MSVAAAVSPRGPAAGGTTNVHHPFAVLTEAEERKKKEAAAAAAHGRSRSIPTGSPPTRNRTSLGAPRPPLVASTTPTTTNGTSNTATTTTIVGARSPSRGSTTKRLSTSSSSTAPSHGRISPSPVYPSSPPTSAHSLNKAAAKKGTTTSAPLGLPKGGLSISTNGTPATLSPALTPAVMAVEVDLSPLPPTTTATTITTTTATRTTADGSPIHTPPSRHSPWPIPIKDTSIADTTNETLVKSPSESSEAAAKEPIAPQSLPVTPTTVVPDSPVRPATPPAPVTSSPNEPLIPPSSSGPKPGSPSIPLAIYEQSLSEHQPLPGSPISPLPHSTITSLPSASDTPLSMTISPMGSTTMDVTGHLDASLLASVSDASAPPTPMSRAVAVEFAPSASFEPLPPVSPGGLESLVTVTNDPPVSSVIDATIRRPVPPSHEPPSPVPYNGDDVTGKPPATTKRRPSRPARSSGHQPQSPLPPSTRSGDQQIVASSPVDAVNAARARIRAMKKAERLKAAERASALAAIAADRAAQRAAARAPPDTYGLVDGEYVDEFVNEFGNKNDNNNINNNDGVSPSSSPPLFAPGVDPLGDDAPKPAVRTLSTITVTSDTPFQHRLGEPQPPQSSHGEPSIVPEDGVVAATPHHQHHRIRRRRTVQQVAPPPLVAEEPPLVRRVDETTAYANRVRAQFYRKARLREVDIEMAKRAAAQRRAAKRVVAERAVAAQAAEEYQNRLRAHEYQGIVESQQNDTNGSNSIPAAALPGLRLRPQSATSTQHESPAVYRQVLATQKAALSGALREAMSSHDRQLDADLGRHAIVHHSRWSALSAALGGASGNATGSNKRRNAWSLHDPRMGKGGDIAPETSYNSVRPSSTIASGQVSPAQPLPSQRSRSVASNNYYQKESAAPPPPWRSGNSAPTDAAVIEAQLVNQSARSALQNYYHLMGQLRASVHRARAPNVIHHVLFGSPAILQPLARPPTASPVSHHTRTRSTSTSNNQVAAARRRSRSPSKQPSSLRGLSPAKPLERHEPEPRSSWDNKVTFPKSADPIPHYDAITDPHARNLTSPRLRRHIAQTRGTTLNPFMANFLDQRVAAEQNDVDKRADLAKSKAEQDRETIKAAHARILGKPFVPSPRYDPYWNMNGNGIEEEKEEFNHNSGMMGYEEFKEHDSSQAIPSGSDGMSMYHVLNGSEKGTSSRNESAATMRPNDFPAVPEADPSNVTAPSSTHPNNNNANDNNNGQPNTIRESSEVSEDIEDEEEPVLMEPDWAALMVLWPAEPSKLSESLISLGVFQAPAGSLPPPLSSPLHTATSSMNELFSLLCTTPLQQRLFRKRFEVPVMNDHHSSPSFL
jgi:hypothetical protein